MPSTHRPRTHQAPPLWRRLALLAAFALALVAAPVPVASPAGAAADGLRTAGHPAAATAPLGAARAGRGVHGGHGTGTADPAKRVERRDPRHAAVLLLLMAALAAAATVAPSRRRAVLAPPGAQHRRPGHGRVRRARAPPLRTA